MLSLKPKIFNDTDKKAFLVQIHFIATTPPPSPNLKNMFEVNIKFSLLDLFLKEIIWFIFSVGKVMAGLKARALNCLNLL